MVTPDGCPVEAYAALPAEPDLSSVLAHLEGRRSVLDLGAGAGRIADPLAKAGFNVLAVDESAEMLERVRHARTLTSRIEDLACNERFDAVLLLSHLVNTPADAQRRQLLATVARHLAANGIAVMQRYDPAAEFTYGRVEHGGIQLSLHDVDASGWPMVRATTRYSIGGRTWDQSWEAVVLDDDAIVRALAEHDLVPLLMQGPWVVASKRAHEDMVKR